ncbi:MAG: hypothetical protein SFV52_14770 [Saprospiraceae bacterium]|nr:hypothetical protein [Saprospiraceae bacterium]
MLRILLLSALPWAISAREAPEPAITHTADQVLNKLYQANGNQIFLKPRIEWSSDTRSVAAFKRRSNTIVLEEKAYTVCRSFGKDSLSALAFILGHELSHAYQEDGWNLAETSFLAHGYTPNSSSMLEKSADIGGVFMAYLAGYRTVEILPGLLDRLYEAYGLKNKTLTGYPPLDERMAAGREVQTLTRELITVFETGVLLSPAGQYEIAASCFDYVKLHYKGREVYNNLGVNNLLQALNFTESTPDVYAYPLELEWQTRLKKPRTTRGEEGLTEADRSLRHFYLSEARRHFETARKMDSRDFTAELNIFCTILLLDGPQAALRYFEDHELRKKAQLTGAGPDAWEKMQIAVGIAWAQSNGTSVARKIWSDLSAKSASPGVRRLAETNLAALNGHTTAAASAPCTLPFPVTGAVDAVRLNRPPLSDQPVVLTRNPLIQMSVTPKATSTVVVFQRNGKLVYALQRIPYGKTPDGAPKGGTVVTTEGGTLLYCEQEKVVLRMAGEQVAEWVKVWTW